MAFVIMSHGAAATLLQRQSRLCAVKSLDRGLLVDTQHERFVWRIQIQSDNVMEFLHKLLIAAQLERPGQVGFQMVLLPDAPDSGFAHALSLGHQAGAPVCCVFRLALQRGFHHSSNLSVRDSGDTAGPRSVFLKPRQTQSQKTLPPELHCGARNSKAPEQCPGSEPHWRPSEQSGHARQPAPAVYDSAPTPTK